MPTWRNPKLRFEVDPERVEEVVRTAAHHWRKYKGQINFRKPPEEFHFPANVIPYGSVKHRGYYFAEAWSNRAGKPSEWIIREIAKVCANMPEMLDHHTSLERMREVLTPIIPFADTSPQYINWWFDNWAKINVKYGGDPANLLKQIKTDEPMRMRKQAIDLLTDEFDGFAHKISQLFCGWLQAVNWSDDPDFWAMFNSIPFVPVDIHHLKGSYQTAVFIRLDTQHKDAIAEPLSEIYSQACLDLGENWIDFAQGMWHIGSSICRKAPQLNHRPERDMERRLQYCAVNCDFHRICVGRIPFNRERSKRGLLNFDQIQLHNKNSGVMVQPFIPGILERPSGG